MVFLALVREELRRVEIGLDAVAVVVGIRVATLGAVCDDDIPILRRLVIDDLFAELYAGRVSQP